MIRERLRSLLSIKDSPGRVAAAFGMGVFIGMSPLLGVHTVLALLIAWAFKLNKVVSITGVYITNPWTIVPIYAFSTWVGTLLLGSEDVIPDIDWNSVTFKSFFSELSPLLWPFIAGTTFVAMVSGGLSYFIVKKAVERARGREKKTD